MDSGLCVIVGVGPSLGMAVARRFMQDGFRVALLSRRQDALETYVANLRDQGGEAYGFVANATDFASLRNAFDQIRRDIGSPDVLIYNAAVARPKRPSELDADAAVYDFTVNTAGALVSAQQVIPDMRERGKGTIIFTGGGHALDPRPEFASLGISKSALRNLAYSLGEELEGEGVHVCTVTVAGFIEPDTAFDPEIIADCYMGLHDQAPISFCREVIFRGKPGACQSCHDGYSPLAGQLE